MSTVGNPEWRGPYESRTAFESFQDECIGQLARFVSRSPLFTDNPDHLQDQLWKIGKYLPAAFLGLGRYNPSVNELIVYGDKSPDIRKHDFSTGPYRPKHTHLTGEAAYERMVNDWHDFDSWSKNHRFDVRSVRETPHQLHAIVWAEKAALVGYWNFDYERQICSSEIVDVPDTSHTNDVNSIDWPRLTANAGDGDFRTRQGYTSDPFYEPGRPSPEEISEAVVQALAGNAALSAFQSYGKVGLYQERLWSGLGQLLAGLDTGPSVTL